MARTKLRNPESSCEPYAFANDRVSFINPTNLTNAQLLDRTVFEGIHGLVMSKVKAASVLKVSRQTVYNMIEDGRLRAIHGAVDTRSVWEFSRGVTA